MKDGWFYSAIIVIGFVIKKCKGSIEGWHSPLKGCFIISEINHDCTNCQCKKNAHKFKNYYIIKKDVTKTKKIIRYKIDENIKQSEEEKKNINGQIILIH